MPGVELCAPKLIDKRWVGFLKDRSQTAGAQGNTNSSSAVDIHFDALNSFGHIQMSSVAFLLQLRKSPELTFFLHIRLPSLTLLCLAVCSLTPLLCPQSSAGTWLQTVHLAHTWESTVMSFLSLAAPTAPKAYPWGKSIHASWSWNPGFSPA